MDEDVVAGGVSGPEAVDGACLQRAVDHDPVEEGARVVEQIAGRGPEPGMVQDGGEAPLQLPRREEERPVDVGKDVGQRHVEHTSAGERGHGDRRRRPLEDEPVAPGVRPRQNRASLERRVLGPQMVLLDPVGRVELRSLHGIQQPRHHVDGTRRVEHVHHGLGRVFERNLHGRVLAARRGPADEERKRHAAGRHFPRDKHHLVE
jgi:hypothetical protein